MSFFSRLRNALSPKRLDDDLRDEISDHLERRAAALREQGANPEEAQRQASLRFGNTTQLREQSRDFRLSATLETTLQDLRYAARGMRKSPAFALTAIFSLALAIGANTAIYSIVDAAMLRPLPVPEPQRLFTVATSGIQIAGVEPQHERESFSYPQYRQFLAAAGDSARLALFSTTASVEARGPAPDAPPEKILQQFVSGEAFQVLGIQPFSGRLFSREEDRMPGGHPVIVLSHDYWQRRFLADPRILGKTLRIGNVPYFIIGIAPRGFFGVEPGRFVDVWLPAMMYNKDALLDAGWNWFRVFGRLAPGATLGQVQARLQPTLRVNAEDLIQSYPTMPPWFQKQYRERQIRVHPSAAGASAFREDFARPLWIVLAVAAGILLIACANVSSLLLARSTARSAEMALRVSLGAGRSRLVRQLLTESLLLSAAAGALGWIFARTCAPALVAMLSRPADPIRLDLAMDTRILLFCAAVSTLAAIFFGLLPAWQASGSQPMLRLRGARAQAGKLRLGRFFVAIQVAFAFCLVIAGASFLFSLRNLLAVDTGFNPHNVAVLTIATDLPASAPPETHAAFLDQLQRQVAALPGIEGAGAAQWAFFEEGSNTQPVILPGKPASKVELFYPVSPRFFDALRTPLLEGRAFDLRDRNRPQGGQPIPSIVNQAFARRYFGAEDVIGKIFQHPAPEGLLDHQIVGVVQDTRYGQLRGDFRPIVYTPLPLAGTFTLFVRSPLDLGSVVRMVNREAQASGHAARIREITTLETQIGGTLRREKLLAGLGGVFAFLGLLLAAIGLFGLLNYSVTRRTKEIGIRAALGARPPALVYLVLKDMFSMIAGGLIAGLAASLSLMTFVRSLLFGIRPVDPLIITTAAAVFLAAAFIAGGLPASRAASIDPMLALRHE